MPSKFTDFLTKETKLLAEEVTAIESHFQTKNIEKGQCIIRENEICRNLFFIEEGCLRIYCLKDDGQEWTRYVAFENEFVSIIPSFINQSPSRSYLESLESTKLQSISYDNFTKLIDTYPEWERLYRSLLEKAYIQSIKRIEDLITMDSKSLYLSHKKENTALVTRLPNKILASYFGISPETLSRIKSKIK